MVHHFTLRRVLGRASSHRVLYLAMSGFGVMLATAPLAAPARAQSATPQSATTQGPANLDLGSVLSTASGNAGNLADTPGTAPYNAPSLTPLNSNQPTSVISQQTIKKQLIGSQSYADAASLSPSVSTISPNGPGLMENQGLTIRGFQDGQFNVTFDGIPIGDSNDFTHHTSSFFMDNDIGQVIVDRGPGTAETVGNATFGGTISVRTKDPLATPTVTPYGEYGSYHTNLGGIELDTGAIQAANGASAIVDVEHLGSSGALQGASQERKNFFGKVVVPVNANTTVTAVAMYNDTYQNPSVGATLEQMQAYGHNYAYNSDPNSQGYSRFNNDHITTDMEYLDVTSNLGNGWEFDGKVYTYGYYHRDLNGDDVGDQLPGGVTAPGGVQNEVLLTPNGVLQPGVPGNNFTNSYRSVGTIDRWQKNFSVANMPSDLKFGFWFDHQTNTRAVTYASLTNGNATDYSQTQALGLPPVVRDQHNQLYTFQPYAQLDITPIQNLTITGGVKYAFFRRQIKDPYAATQYANVGYEHNWDKLLPSLEVRYSFSPNLSAYAQVAEGFLAPNVNFISIANPQNSSFQPETTWNYQTGFAYQSQHLALGGDIYLVHFVNFVTTGPTVDGFTTYTSGGGAIYKGIEGEATYTFDNGISLFANGGLNKANYTSSNNYIAETPQFTSNFGVIYNKNNIYASAIDQVVGGEYDANGTPANNPRAPGAWYNPYNIVNLVGGYTFVHPLPHVQALDVKLNLDNITNQQQIIWSPGTTSPATGPSQPLYYVLPGVSAFVSVSIPINF